MFEFGMTSPLIPIATSLRLGQSHLQTSYPGGEKEAKGRRRGAHWHVGYAPSRKQTFVPEVPNSKRAAEGKCNFGEHLCAMIMRNSGHVCGLKHPACHHKLSMPSGRQGHP